MRWLTVCCFATLVTCEWADDDDVDAGGDGDSDADADADGDGDSDGDADADGDADGDSDADADVDGDSDADADTDGDTDGDSDADADTPPERPEISYEVGSCDALLEPAVLDDPEVIGAWAALIDSLGLYRPNYFMVNTGTTAGVGNCDEMRVEDPNRFYDVNISAGEGCGSDGRWWWGSLAYRRVTMPGGTTELSADGFSQILPEEYGVTLLQLDGYGTFNPRAQVIEETALYVHVERVDGLPSGEWYLERTREESGGPEGGSNSEVRGYFRNIDGEWGPVGDLCFEGSYLLQGSVFASRHLHLIGAGTGTATPGDGSWEGALGLCDPGLTPCGDECPDVTGDRNHCGACDVVCDEDEACGAGQCVPVVAEEEPNDDGDTAQSLEGVPAIDGELEDEQDNDYYAIDLTEGDTMALDFAACGTDTVVFVYGKPVPDPLPDEYACDGAAAALACSDDGDGPCSMLEFVAPADGTYYLRVVGYGGISTGPYLMVVGVE